MITLGFIMLGATLAAFFDELEKIGVASSVSSKSTSSSTFGAGDGEQSTGDISSTPTKPGEVKQPLTPTHMKPKVIDSPSGRGTNYTRANVEAPGSNVSITASQKNAPPPPIRV